MRKISAVVFRYVGRRYVVGAKCYGVLFTISTTFLLLGTWLSKDNNIETVVPNVRSSASSTWLQRRQRLMSGEGNVAKVLLYTYMRGGSSVFSRIFDLDPKSSNVLMFEPLDSFYTAFFGLPQFNQPLSLLYQGNLTRRVIGETEYEALTTFLENVLRCHIDDLPVEMLAHRQFVEQADIFKSMVRYCFPSRSGNASLYACSLKLMGVCGGSDFNRPNISVAIMNRCHETITALREVNPRQTEEVFRNVRRRVSKMVYKNETADGEQILIRVDFMKKFLAHHHCIAGLETPVRRCWEGRGKKLCQQAQLVVTKVTRASLQLLERLIERTPDIHIVYYTRDPRAIAWSRVQNGTKLQHTHGDRNAATEARVLCVRMRDDLHSLRYLESKFPGVFLSVHYEDFVLDTEGVTAKVYGHIGRPPPSRELFNRWKRRAMNSKADNSMFGTIRANATTVISKWRRNVSEQDTSIMNQHCGDVLNALGYSL